MSENVIEIDVESEIQKIIQQLDSLSDQVAAPRILQQALNSAGRKVRKQFIIGAYGKYALKDRKVLKDKSKGGPELLTASTSNLTAVIRSRGPMQEIMTFMTRPNTATGAAAAKVLSSNPFRPLGTDRLKAFVARFSSRHIAIVQRDPPRKYSDAKSKSRRVKLYGPKADMTKIKKLLSPSVPHMLNNEAVRGPAEDMTYELLQAEIQRRIDKIKLG